MSKKTSLSPRIAPLQRVIAEPITDPAEQATLDKIRKRQKRKQRERGATRNRKGAKAALSSVAKKERNGVLREGEGVKNLFRQ